MCWPRFDSWLILSSPPALDFECEVGLLIDNLAIATGTEMLSVAWKPVYADNHVRLESWSKFISDVYWNAELKK